VDKNPTEEESDEEIYFKAYEKLTQKVCSRKLHDLFSTENRD